jgi:hypothetical protein
MRTWTISALRRWSMPFSIAGTLEFSAKIPGNRKFSAKIQTPPQFDFSQINRHSGFSQKN